MKNKIEAFMGMSYGGIILLIISVVSSGTLVYASITEDVRELQEWRLIYIEDSEENKASVNGELKIIRSNLNTVIQILQGPKFE